MSRETAPQSRPSAAPAPRTADAPGLRGSAELLAHAEQFRLLVDGALDYAILMLDPEGHVASWNAGAERIKGYRSQEIIGTHFAAFYTAADREAGLPERLLATARTERRVADEGWRVRRDGTRFWATVVITALYGDDGSLRGYSKITRDLTERHGAELARREAERRFHAAFEQAPIGVALVGIAADGRGRFLHTNPALAAILGREPGELDGERIAPLAHVDDLRSLRSAFAQLETGEAIQLELRMMHRAGHEVWAQVSCTPVRTDGGVLEYGVAQVMDISERKRFEGQLLYLADHDRLTGLYNRNRFEAELQRVVAETRRHGRPNALLMLDLDGFKYVNDRFGHAVGDELVGRIAGVVRQSVRSTDIVARLGGDEFAVILQEATEAEAIVVAEKILEVIRHRSVVMHGMRSARATTSIGITTFAGDCSLIGDELLVEADIAMYDAKAEGRDRYAVYDRSVNRREVVSARHSWLERLRTAIDQDMFELYAQPIIGICGNGIPRYELLLRLRDEHGGLIPPGAFLYNAERFDLMGQIDRWVLQHAVRLLHDHTAAGNEISLAVNLSGKTMNDATLAEDLRAILAAHPIPDGRLVIEVTETAAIVNIERARQLAKELRQLGCLFALDDFGAGFASFYYLKHLDFDYLKVDGEFVKALVDTHTDQLVVRAVVDIAKGLGTKTVAEFVGDDQTVELLRDLGVDYGQGFHLGRPGPLALKLPALPPRVP